MGAFPIACMNLYTFMLRVADMWPKCNIAFDWLLLAGDKHLVRYEVTNGAVTSTVVTN